MSRAFLVVIDSVGCGGAPDAAELTATQGANTLGHIAEACAAGRAEEGRSGPLRLPNLDALGLAAAIGAGDSGATCRGLWRRCRGRLGRGDRSLAGQGHALGPLGAGRRAGAVGLALLPAHDARLPRRSGGRGLPHRRRPAGILGNCHGLGDRILEAAWRRTHADRLADLLHLGRQRVPDRRARGDLRARPAARRSASGSRRDFMPMRVGRVIARPFVGDARTASRRTHEPPRLCHRATGADAAATGSRARGARSTPSARSATSSRAAASAASPRARRRDPDRAT